MTSISVTATGNGTTTAGTYELYIAVEPGAGNTIPTTAAATLTFTAPPTPLQVLTFNLNTPFSVLDNGTLYRFIIRNITTPPTNVRYNSVNDYPDGNFVGEFGNYNTWVDLDFAVCINNGCPTSSPESIPTLSEWAYSFSPCCS